MTVFSRQLLNWYDRHGRKDLPWHRHRDPYAIWVSEIMLQQTQVTTVIPYYNQFMKRFPTLHSLAAAPTDEVLHYWTGLGYYARARNLHRAAKTIVDELGGRFPQDLDSLCGLPGIGRSTAGAILAFSFNQRHPILDGNVKRVLTRYHRIKGWPGQSAVVQQMWILSERHTPNTRVADYTQAIMDLGATLCRRTRPQCANCPLNNSCQAYRHGDPTAYPDRAPRRKKPSKAVNMIMVQADQCVLLEQRPPTGIWGGLWGFPECMPDEDMQSKISKTYGLTIETRSPWTPLRHGFTHFDLTITPVPAVVVGDAGSVMENPSLVWYNPQSPDRRGLAAPVKRLLDQLRYSD